MLGNYARHQVIVTVGDGYLADRLWFGVVVLRPQDAASFMWDWLHNHFDTATDPTSVVQLHLIPILRDIPRWVPIHRLIWRGYYSPKARP